MRSPRQPRRQRAAVQDIQGGERIQRVYAQLGIVCAEEACERERTCSDRLAMVP
jgi:hypothetical protein